MILILTIGVISCQSQTEKNYADELKSCLPKEDVDLLNKATSYFEKLLSERYGNSDNNENFYNYLTEIGLKASKRVSLHI